MMEEWEAFVACPKTAMNYSNSLGCAFVKLGFLTLMEF